MDKKRQQIINEAYRILIEIDQMYVDTEHWNSHHPGGFGGSANVNATYKDELPVDPDGLIRKIQLNLRKLLKNEAAMGHYPEHVPEKETDTPSRPDGITDAWKGAKKWRGGQKIECP